jgi:beta-D-galactosyl-(1->4)-L-rhamnose phosphorylase
MGADKMAAKNTGSFTIPGESGYEQFTLKVAKKWGADVIRDSDGTVLSDKILNAGYGIYSTICLIRDHNAWAKENMDKLQQSFLMTQPVVATRASLTIPLMTDYFTDQFSVNSTANSLKYWQVFDRTSNCEVPKGSWCYQSETQSVTISNTALWHRYTVNFLAYRIWEEISMYNHTTNHWNKEHLMQIDPRYPQTQQYMLTWMENWCQSHPDTSVVRFTSMFYNFAWIWGSSPNNRDLFSDWGSYDFTVSPLALDTFAKKYGYALTSEDFINQGKLHATHLPANRCKLDWMEFINDFVIEFGKKLVAITHKYNKLAYVFYDDSWIGVEPYSPRFSEFGFDGIIKCVFSGFEARMCSGVKGVKTHELRLHPYLFPVGFGGAPTFMEGGNPTLDAKKFWNSIRRALLRAPIDRIGLGGYLHLVEPYPDFCDYISKIADEFRTIKSFHEAGKPYCLKPKVGILTSWGKFRPWICSGHYHEHPELDLINVLESLSGTALEVEFLSFEDVRNGIPKDISVIINAGAAGSAWSGGDRWNDDAVVEALTAWVYHGGAFLGVNEPSAVTGYDTAFRMAHVLGIDKDNGERICHGRWAYIAHDAYTIMPQGSHVAAQKNLYLTDGLAAVLAEENGVPIVTAYEFSKGKGIYFSSYQHNLENTRMLLNAILYASGQTMEQPYITDNLNTECAYFSSSDTLVVINNSDATQTTTIPTLTDAVTVTIAPYDTKII